MDPYMDPLAIRLLGKIRQQELLEQAGKGREESRRLRSRVDSFRADVWREGDSALTDFNWSDGEPRFYHLRAFVTALMQRVSGRAKRLTAPGIQQDAQVLTDSQCITEC